MMLPIHRWFRYSAGFSASWVRGLIEEQKAEGRCHVFDPFAGSGTVLLEAERCQIDAIGVEAHPFVVRLARAKLYWWENPASFHDYATSLLEQAQTRDGDVSNYPALITKCFPSQTLARLDTLRTAWAARADGSSLSELTWLALVSIIRECSPVGTAQWQYVLPNKSKVRTTDPYTAFADKVELMCEDMAAWQRAPYEPGARAHREDARLCPSVPDEWADLVITSPPYANNYDYADATRLEMTFMGEICGWGDLQSAVRQYLVRSCTQHVTNLIKQTQQIIDSPLLAPIRSEMTVACTRLEVERNGHGGKKAYHTMLAAYFEDLAKVWLALRRVTKRGALICFVIGDSAPYGVHIPVERWLGELALAAGFASYRFEKTRDRNIKWKNRKHRVPLHEGYLWVEG